MKSCKDFEQEIYFYRELAKADKEDLDNHLSGCEQCSALLAIVQQTEALIFKTKSGKLEPENSARLTSTIMQAVADQKRQSQIWFTNPFVRYGMATVSFALITAFGVESFSRVEPSTKRYPSAKTVTLNSSSLAKSFLEKKDQPEKPSLYACVKSGECNTLIENFKKGPF